MQKNTRAVRRCGATVEKGWKFRKGEKGRRKLKTTLAWIQKQVIEQNDCRRGGRRAGFIGII